MTKFLTQAVDTYRVESLEEVEMLHEELKNDTHFDLVSFTYKMKHIKEKGEIVETYYLVSAKMKFNEEKEPDMMIEIKYEVLR